MNNRMIPVPIVKEADDLETLAAAINAEHEAGQGKEAEALQHTRGALEHYKRAGDKLLKAKKQCGHGNWLKWLKGNVRFDQRSAWKYMHVAKNWSKLEPSSNLTLTEALRLLTAEGDETEPGAPLAGYITLDQWNALLPKEQQKALVSTGTAKFNDQQDNENIEWALWSWNPVTGCKHDCPYCYARDIAERFYPQKFEPSLWPGRLSCPKNTSVPAERVAEAEASGDLDGRVKAIGLRNVFVCSMADLFGRWVPSEWIEAVLEQVRAAPQWTFLFLTKFPIRMAEFEFPDNTWVGTTVDCQARVANAERAFRKVQCGVKWLSLEPLIEPLRFTDLGAFDWVVIGGSSRSSRTPEWMPPRQWVQSIEAEVWQTGGKVYEKSNLFPSGGWPRIRQYPGVEDEADAVQAPDELRYLPGVEAKS